MKHASLFSGIGGFDLAAEWCGWENIFQVEKNDFCQRILRKNFPGSKLYGDIREFSGKEWGGSIDVLTGGFPCQPFSSAGRRRGTKDDRHLWPQMLRVIREIRPTWICGENVAGILSMAQYDDEPPMDDKEHPIGVQGDTYHRTGRGILHTILEDLEKEGYSVQTIIIPACAVQAWHRRDRIWIIAHSEGNNNHGNPGELQKKNEQVWKKRQIQGDAKSHRTDKGNVSHSNCNEHCKQEQGSKNKKIGISDADRTQDCPPWQSFGADRRDDPITRSKRMERRGFQAIPKLRGLQRSEDGRIYADIKGRSDLSTPVLCGSYDGIPDGMDRVSSYGNAIVPQVAYQIFQAIEHAKN